MSVDLPSAEQPATIHRYRVSERLRWQPPEGVAYDAVGEDGRRVELWVVPADDSAFAARFMEEATTLAGVEDDHLPRIVDTGESEDGVYVAIEATEGVTLQSVVFESGGVAPMRAIRVLGEIADGLDTAHEAGLLHGRISSASVLVEHRPLERALLQGFALGATGKSRDEDLRAFAGVMYECFTGSPPEGDTAASEVRPELPAELDAVLAPGLSAHGRRPASAAALVGEAAKAVMSVAPAAAAAPAPSTPAAPTRQPEGAPVADRRVPLRRRLARATVPLALGAVVVGAAAVGGWIVGKPESGASAPQKISSGTVELGLPAGWHDTRAPRGLGSLRLDGAVAGAGATGGRIEAGLTSGTLPSRVGARVARKPGKPAAVRLGHLQAYVWRNVEERGGGGRITLYAAGTDAGLVTVACGGQGAALSRCNAAAGSLAVPEALPVKLGELDSWAARLDAVVTRLSRRRSRDRAKLRSAKTSGSSAAAARRLRKDYSSARRSLSAHRAPAGATSAQRELERSLSGIAQSYRRLASAARRQQSARYRSASRSIANRESELQRTLRRL